MDTPRIAGQAPRGHLPSFRYEHVAPGYAACVACGRTITLAQLAGERCSGAARRGA